VAARRAATEAAMVAGAATGAAAAVTRHADLVMSMKKRLAALTAGTLAPIMLAPTASADPDDDPGTTKEIWIYDSREGGRPCQLNDF
jgi:hypothetical protein